MEKMTCNIVFQTHWDREWYLPFEVFRHRLTQVMDRIVSGLEAGELQQFVLDGQMAALEDYFDVCEEGMKEKVLQFIQEKKIIIGPWYVLADEFLVSGESLVRNLQIGLGLARRYGKPQMVGYLPDTFGHVSQMPQLLRGFHIDNAILWRGLQPASSELKWQAPNGSDVLAIFLPEGYYQPLLNAENVQEQINSYVEKVRPYAKTSHLLLTNGGDHIMPSYGSMFERIQDLQGEVDFVSSSYEQFLSSVKADLPEDIPVHKGEMRSNDHIYLLPNVLSTRTYLKQQNQAMEDELSGYTEPLAALLMKERYPYRYLEESWKLLMLNHPHDSICGCSIDEVHQEMETRSMTLQQRLHSLQRGALSFGGIQDASESGQGMRKPFDDNRVFTVFHPHPRSYSGWVLGEIWLDKNQDFELLDSNGNYYTPTILEKREDHYFASPLDAFPEFKKGSFYRIGFYAENLPATSLTTFRVVEGEADKLRRQESGVIQNHFIKIELAEDGTLEVLNKETGLVMKGLQQFYSSLDAGDEYNYSPPLYDRVTKAKLSGIPHSKKSANVEELTYRLELNTPVGLNERRNGPSEGFIPSIIHVHVRVYAHDRKIHSTFEVENRAKDQRLRVKYPLGTDVKHTFSDTAFDVIERKARKQEEFDAKKQREVPVVVEPSHSFIHTEEHKQGITFYHRGLQEYQLSTSKHQDALEVTVIRSVGWLSRDDLRTRGGGAGPHMETPGAQCIGTYTFQVAFEVGARRSVAEVANEAHLYRVPPRIYPGETREHENSSLVEMDNEAIQWSALYRVAEGVVLRLWNPTDKPQKVKLSTKAEAILRVNFLHEVVEQVYNGSDQLAPKEIVTYVLRDV